MVHFSGYGWDECQTNDVHVFDFGMYTWSKPVIKGTHPSPRDSHSSTAVGSKLYFFESLKSLFVPGAQGWNQEKKKKFSPMVHFSGYGWDECQTNDVHVFDFGMYTWSKPVIKGTHPSPQDSHSSTAVGSKLYVFGDTNGTSPLDDLFVLDNDTFVWKKISTTGVSPIPQDSHTCSSYKNCFVVKDSGNPETMAWREVKTTGAKLMPRAGHTTISHGKYLASTGVWATSNPSGSRPAPRFSLAGDSVDAERGILFVYEGCWLLLLLTLLPFLTIWLPFFCEEMLREKDPSEPKLSMQFQAHVQPLGKKMFEARESDVFNYGYMLEASIDGKLFRGLLFLYKPGFAQAVQTYMARKENITGGNHRTSKRP
ncbi:hypothetical protein SELMODRAFT_432181 [Selaginella moellendorffii]|uniref:Uncharacterized protein n=1 Tax=Selaginella moellendorffii TaxID=88036 RepID=D8TF83_SELML|nr:hypothetical protein SELMODRAFT_432181 [Selaginella moellendorffii]